MVEVIRRGYPYPSCPLFRRRAQSFTFLPNRDMYQLRSVDVAEAAKVYRVSTLVQV